MPFFGGGGGDYHIVATNIKGGTQAAPAVIGDNNMALGNGAGQNLLNADSNIFIGNNAGNAITTGSDNTIIGHNAGAALTTENFNVHIGADISSTGAGSTLINILQETQSGPSSSDNCICIGGNSIPVTDFVFSGSNSIWLNTEKLTTDVTISYSVALSSSVIIGGSIGTEGIRRVEAQNSVIIGEQFDATSGYFANGISVGYGNTLPGNELEDINCVILGNNVNNNSTNYIAIGHDIVNAAPNDAVNSITIGHFLAPVADSIVIGDVTHTSVTIGGIDLFAISGGNFTSAIIGDPGTEGAGVNINGVVYDSTFKVSDIDGTNFAQTILHRHSTILEPLIVGARSNSDTTAHADVTAGMGLFSIFGTGWAGANYKIFGQEQFAADDTGAISNTSAPGKWTLSLTPNGAVTPATVAIARNNKTVEFKAGISVGGATPGASGVAFPAVAVGMANANTLDDYEEGTFTPGATCATPGDLNAGIISATGRYVKIGNRVYFSISIVAIPTYTTATGDVVINGLPFVSSASQNAATFSAQVTNWTGPAGAQSVQGSLIPSMANFRLQKQNNVGSSAFGYALITEFTSGTITSMGASGFYEV